MLGLSFPSLKMMRPSIVQTYLTPYFSRASSSFFILKLVKLSEIEIPFPFKWLNSLYKGHYIFASHLPKTIKNPEDSPAWLSEGITCHNLQIININYHRENVCIHGE